MKHLVLSLFLVAAGSLFAATVEERNAARTELLAGVQAIDVGGGAIPGAFVLSGDDAFPLAECRNRDGSAAFAAAGAFHGYGRAVFLAHPSYLSDHSRRDTSRFMKNAVRWMAKGKENPRIAALRNDGIVNAYKKLGFTDITKLSAPPEPGAYDVLLATSADPGEVEAVLAFIKAGGGYMSGPLGWGYLYYYPLANFAEDFAENRISGRMGIIMNTSGVNRIDGAFPTACENLPDGTFVDDAFAIALGEKKSTKQSLKQTTETLSCLITGLPGAVRPELEARLQEMLKNPEADKVPNPDAPVTGEDVFARLAILARKNAWLANPEKPVAADPGAAVYPGLVKEGTPKIERIVSVAPSIPRWHSTGVFAVAGEPVTVKIAADAVKLGLKVRIGSTADDLSELSVWKRNPRVTCEAALTKETTTVYNPFGGLVYIVLPDNCARKEALPVEISGGVMAPWFKLGRDTNEQFVKDCRETGAPYGEIEGNSFVVIAQITGLRGVDDATWIAEYWDRVLAACQDLAQWKTRRYPERFCSDVQLVAGWLHNGYPLMSHLPPNRIDWFVNRAHMEAGNAWGCFHEIGHNHQNRDWTPDGTGEVTVNLFTTYALEVVNNANIREERYPCGSKQSARRVQKWVDGGKPFSGFKGDYFLALEMYVRIKEAYGWGAYKKTFARYLEPGFVRPKNDAEKWQIFAKELSKTVNADMAEVLAQWSIPITAETKKFCAQFPPARESLTEGLVKEACKDRLLPSL